MKNILHIWAGHVARIGERRGAHRVLVGKLGGKEMYGRPGRRWEDSIKMDLKEVRRGARTGLIWFKIGRSSGLL